MNLKIKQLLDAEYDPAYAKRASFIFETLENTKPKKILEVGCGRGFYIQAFSVYDFPSNIYGVDLNPNYLEKAKKVCNDNRVMLQEGTIYKLPYKTNTFDYVLLSEILEHVPDDKKALQEIRRVLKPGGSLVITVPNERFPFLWDPINWLLMKLFKTHIHKDIWWLAGIWADHDHLYTKEQLVAVVKTSGFHVQDVRPVLHYCWPFSHFLLYGIGENIVERLGIKEFDRFNFQKKRSSLLAKIFRFPSTFDSQKHKTYMNICLVAVK